MNAVQTDWDNGAAHEHQSAVVILHRLLRGKYILTISLALILGLFGAGVGYKSKQPQYESFGQIRIQPSLPKVLFSSEQNSATQMFSSFVNTQALLIKNPGVIQRALESDEWKSVSHLTDVKAPFDVRKLLKVNTSRTAQQIIVVSYSDENARVSAMLVNAVMVSYMAQFENEGSIDNPQIRNILNQREDELIALRDTYNTEILTIAGRYNTENLQPLVEAALEKINQLESQRDLYVEQRNRYEQNIARGSEGSSESMTAEQAAFDDPMIAGLVLRGRELTEARDEMMIAEGLREGHRDVQRLTSMIDNNQRKIDERLEELQSGDETLILVDTEGNAVPTGAELESRISKLDSDISLARATSKKLFEDTIELKDVWNKRVQVLTSIAQVAQRLDQIETESKVKDTGQITGKISIVGLAIPPVEPTSDSRIKMAAAGFVGLGSLPVMVILALGFFSHRVQYSDDDILMGSGAGIVGMLPDLGDSLSDRELAAASAFAVHQIRSQLQIKNSQRENRVYGVTSPAPQDGKTSLIIALGLSFAESGSRTLLVDMDFIGRGLSVHFGHPNAPSLADSLLSSEEIDSLIHETEFDGLSVLPAGFG
ncbi:MAG: hypothetical protein JKX70_04420, partial [Phycisphaerales bacterium]|nr:hypothetical protein [Phycisphaerales bacterium]